MEELDTAWCPCQEERFEAQYPNCDKSDMPYVDGVDYLERVKTAWYWKQKREQASKERPDFSFRSGPSAPQTRRGEKIIEENFPEADFVCPCCEAEYVEEVTIRKQQT